MKKSKSEEVVQEVTTNDLASFSAKEQELELQLETLRQERKTAQESRLKAIEEQRTTLRTQFEEQDNKLRTEQDDLERSLGIIPRIEIAAAVVGDEDEPVGKNKPKKLDLGMDSKDKAYPDSYWKQLIQNPVSGSKFRSLDGYVCCVLNNADGGQVNVETLVAACKALGYKSKSENFETNVRTALVRLKKEGMIEVGSKRGVYIITREGKKWINQTIKEIKSSEAEDKPARKNETVASSDTKELILKAINDNNGRLSANDIGTAVLKVGYQPKGDDAEATSEDLRNALASLRDEGKIQFAKDEEGHTVFEGVKNG